MRPYFSSEGPLSLLRGRRLHPVETILAMTVIAMTVGLILYMVVRTLFDPLFLIMSGPTIGFFLLIFLGLCKRRAYQRQTWEAWDRDEWQR